MASLDERACPVLFSPPARRGAARRFDASDKQMPRPLGATASTCPKGSPPAGGSRLLGALLGGFDGFGRRVAERKLAAVGEADLGGAGAGVAVAGLEGLDDDLGARGQRVSVP